MTNLRFQIALAMVVLVGLSYSFPHPGGHGGKHHVHFIIHVPHFIEKHHHTHTKKIYIPVKSHGGGGGGGHHDHSAFEAIDGW